MTAANFTRSSSTEAPLPRETAVRVLRRLPSSRHASVELCEMLSAHAPLKRFVRKRLLDVSERFRARFAREAEFLRAIEHENIVRFYDYSAAEQTICMEYVEGGDVASIVAECGPLPLQIALYVADGCGRALEYVHGELDPDQALVHRDISPENVMLSSKGLVKLIDFGVSQVAGRGQTRVGHDGYAAPEQTLDVSCVTAASDVFALGALFYFMVVGRGPFEVAAGEHRSTSGLHDPVPASCPEPVARLVSAMLDPLPQRRPSIIEARRRIAGISSSYPDLAIPRPAVVDWFTNAAPRTLDGVEVAELGVAATNVPTRVVLPRSNHLLRGAVLALIATGVLAAAVSGIGRRSEDHLESSGPEASEESEVSVVETSSSAWATPLATAMKTPPPTTTSSVASLRGTKKKPRGVVAQRSARREPNPVTSLASSRAADLAVERGNSVDTPQIDSDASPVVAASEVLVHRDTSLSVAPATGQIYAVSVANLQLFLDGEPRGVLPGPDGSMIVSAGPHLLCASALHKARDRANTSACNNVEVRAGAIVRINIAVLPEGVVFKLR